MCSNPKLVVFDLDETLGYFVQLGMFWDGLEQYCSIKNIPFSFTQHTFNSVLDLYPEFIRPNIFNTLQYLVKKKKLAHCHKLMIYTNNQGPEEWAKFIIEYFNNKLGFNLFDQIIAAFKVQETRIELCRTSHMKNHKDFLSCTKVPQNSLICYIDDVFYPDMHNDHIYYINIRPYTYDLSINELIERLINSNLFPELTNFNEDFTLFIESFFTINNYMFIPKNAESFKYDIKQTKQLLQHFKIFFNIKLKTLNYTKKHKRNKNNKTLKNKLIKY
jgi:hypothetical protein